MKQKISSEEKTLLRYFFWRFLLFLFGLILGLTLAFKGCNNKPETDNLQLYKDEVARLNKSNNLLNRNAKILNYKIDSLELIKQKEIKNYRVTKSNTRDSLKKYVCDTIGILNAFELFSATCDTVIKIDSTLINGYKSLLSNRNQKIENDSLLFLSQKKELSNCRDSLKTSLRSKAKYFKGFFHGFGAGVILTESANIAKDLKH